MIIDIDIKEITKEYSNWSFVIVERPFGALVRVQIETTSDDDNFSGPVFGTFHFSEDQVVERNKLIKMLKQMQIKEEKIELT